MSHYAILPKLPVPSLGVSLDIFLCSLRPLLSPTEYSEAVRLTGVFSDRQGPYLQAKLARLAEGTDNWASHVWVQTRYLSNRSSLPVTNGSSALLTSFKWTGTADMLSTLSRYIMYMVPLVQAITTGTYPQDTVGGVPLCMEQYRYMAGGHRIPGPDRDTYSLSPDSRHIVVMHTGSVYKVPVCRGGEEGTVSVQEMYSLLSQVISLSEGSHGEGERAVGLLTALERDQWYSVRQQLMQSPTNRESLSAIEGSLFGVCLDTSDANTPADLLKQSRFGDRTGNFKFFNRWYGICCQSVFIPDGWLSWVTEHSMLDGGAIGLYAGMPDLTVPVETSSEIWNSKVELLNWEISPTLRAKQREAQLFLSQCYHKYDIHTFLFSDYGKDFLKRHDIYFQGYMQLCLQLSYHRLYHGLAAAYQPVSLRGFRHGRLEQPHSASAESRSFSEAMSDRASSDRDRYRLMLRGVRRHKEIATEAAQGNVYLKHLQALNMLAEREHMEIDLFNTSAYKVFTEPMLSGSSVYSPINGIGIYLPTSGEGHFIVFQPLDESQTINFAVCSVASSEGHVTSEEFSSTLWGVLLELRQLVESQAGNGVSSKL